MTDEANSCRTDTAADMPREASVVTWWQVDCQSCVEHACLVVSVLLEQSPPHDDLSDVRVCSIFDSLLATTGSNAMFKLAVQSYFWKASAIHACNVAGPVELY